MGIFKDFFLKQALKAKLKDVPEAERNKLMAVMEKHPVFFKKIGEEVQRRVKSGQSEMAATMVVMREHQAELQKIMTE
jgi:adenylosuccinate synthase